MLQLYGEISLDFKSLASSFKGLIDAALLI